MGLNIFKKNNSGKIEKLELSKQNIENFVFLKKVKIRDLKELNLSDNNIQDLNH